jgi:AraC family transcriptional regulator of adaptative response/methylated-DNA-[protein]-cysteine methyltransferase
LKVWNCLLEIPMGRLRTYTAIANRIGQPSAKQAIGRAVVSNPVALLIPCHRVICASGEWGGYLWGVERKKIVFEWEIDRLKRSK